MIPISLAAYARHRGVSHVAVTKAIATGRLVESVVHDERGQPKIADPDRADAEWEANTRPRLDRGAQPERSPQPRGESSIPEYNASRALREQHAARREAALADMAEIEVAERRGEIVSVADARRDVINKFTVVKTKLLSVPSRVAQRLPRLATEIVPILEAMLHEVLEELAVDDDEA